MNKIFIKEDDSVAYYWNGTDLVKVGKGRTTLADYGITDAYTKGEADTKHTALPEQHQHEGHEGNDAERLWHWRCLYEDGDRLEVERCTGIYGGYHKFGD